MTVRPRLSVGRSPPGPGVPSTKCRHALRAKCLPARRSGNDDCERCAGANAKLLKARGCTGANIDGFCRGYTADPLLQKVTVPDPSVRSKL